MDLARDGEEGIDCVLRGDLPHIVILGVGLPRADGVPEGNQDGRGASREKGHLKK